MKIFSKPILVMAIVLLATVNSFSAPDFAAKVKDAMKELMAQCSALGAPKTNGTSVVASQKDVPILYFGSTAINNTFTVVDNVKNKMGGTATLFVKKGDEFIRVSTNVQKDDGTRAIGTILDPKGAAIKQIQQGKPFYGEVEILGKPYITGYEPIIAGGKVIGVYYVGYLKLAK